MTLQELLELNTEWTGAIPVGDGRNILLSRNTPDIIRWSILKEQWKYLCSTAGEEEANERVANSLKVIENVKNARTPLWHIHPKGLEGPDEMKASLSAADYKASVDELRQFRGLKPKGGEWVEI